MAKIAMLVLCVLFSPMVMAEQSREECWLDNMPGTKNDFVARQVVMDYIKNTPYLYAKFDGEKQQVGKEIWGRYR